MTRIVQKSVEESQIFFSLFVIVLESSFASEAMKNSSRTIVKILLMAAIKPRHLLACKFVKYWESSATSAHVKLVEGFLSSPLSVPMQLFFNFAPCVKSDSKLMNIINANFGRRISFDLLPVIINPSHTPSGWKMKIQFRTKFIKLQSNFSARARDKSLIDRRFLRWHQRRDCETKDSRWQSMNELDCRLKSLNHQRLIKRNKN